MLSPGFILLTLAMAVIIFVGVVTVSNRAMTAVKARSAFKRNAALVLGGWLAYITIFSLKGVFNTASLPPRVPLLLVFPAFAFIIFFFKSGRFSNFIDHVPARWPVFIQSFRIFVELLLAGLFVKNMVPKEATFEGYNFDIIMGITALIVGVLAFAGGRVKKGLLFAWNAAGFCTLAVVSFIFISQAYFPGLWHRQQSIISMGFGLFPYTYLAGFLMPFAVFMHVLSVVKTSRS